MLKSRAEDTEISLQDVLHIFWDWQLSSIPVEVSFLGRAGTLETVRVSVDGIVTLVDPEGIVTVSGVGRELSLDLRRCEFSPVQEVSCPQVVFQPQNPDSILRVNFLNGEICLVFPYRRVSRIQGDRGRASSGLDWLRNKLARPAVMTVPKNPRPSDLEGSPTAGRNFFVDVWNSQASIVEVVDKGNGESRIRRLREQFLPQDERMRAERLKHQIIYTENRADDNQNGPYPPQNESSARELSRLVEALERHDGPHAWDRRRYPR